MQQFKRARRPTLGALTLVVALAVGACGGSSSGGDATSATTPTGKVAPTSYQPSGQPPLSAAAGLAEAKRLVAAESQPERKTPPTEPVDASKAKGKTLLAVSITDVLPIIQTLDRSMKQAVGLAGASLKTADGQGQVSEQSRAVQEGVAQRVDALTLMGVPTKLVQAQLSSAKAAGIPVIQAFEWDPGLPPADEQGFGVRAQVSFCYSCAGKRMAHFTIADSGGRAHVAIFSSSDGQISAIEVAAMQDEFRRLCPGCTVKVIDVPTSQWQSRLPTVTQTLVRQDPSIDYILPVFDAEALMIGPALHQAGAAGRVKVVSFNATPAVLQMLAKGDVVAADVGANNVWTGWGIADEFFRLMGGQSPVADEHVPMRTFTKANIGAIDLGADESTWYGPSTWEAAYKRTWGLGG